MHVFSGFSGLIVYGENIYKEYNNKKKQKKTILILLLFETEKQSWGENIPKSASERAAAILVWKSAV